MIFQTAQHVIAFVAAAFDPRMQAVAGTIVSTISGNEDRACDIDDHNLPPEKECKHYIMQKSICKEGNVDIISLIHQLWESVL